MSGYVPGRRCDVCGGESPYAPTCGECETAQRYEARLDKLRALCREAAHVMSRVPIVVSEPAKGLGCYSCFGCTAVGDLPCDDGCWVPPLEDMVARLREAGRRST